MWSAHNVFMAGAILGIFCILHILRLQVRGILLAPNLCVLTSGIRFSVRRNIRELCCRKVLIIFCFGFF